MTNIKKTNRIQSRTTRFSGWTWQQYKKERKKKLTVSCFRFFFAIGVSVAFLFSWGPQEWKGSKHSKLQGFRLTLQRTGLFSK